eukprot:scaffold1087_cov198-Pinguiococcus_pyrenoidosus.AAC.23
MDPAYAERYFNKGDPSVPTAASPSVKVPGIASADGPDRGRRLTSPLAHLPDEQGPRAQAEPKAPEQEDNGGERESWEKGR